MAYAYEEIPNSEIVSNDAYLWIFSVFDKKLVKYDSVTINRYGTSSYSAMKHSSNGNMFYMIASEEFEGMFSETDFTCLVWSTEDNDTKAKQALYLEISKRYMQMNRDLQNAMYFNWNLVANIEQVLLNTIPDTNH